MRKYLSSFSPAILIFFTTLLVYLLVWSGRHYSIDGIVMFEYAKALLFQRSFIMDPPVYWADQNIVTSVWSLGQTLVYMPILLALSILFPTNQIYRQIPFNPHNPYNPLLLENSPYRIASLIHPFVTSLTAALVYILGRRLGLSKKAACAAALIFGLASPAAAYARYDFAQPLASLFLLTGITVLSSSRTNRLAVRFLTGLLAGLTILTRPEMVVIAGIPVGLMILWEIYQEGYHRQGKWMDGVFQLGAFIAPLTAILVFLLFANQQRFGSPLKSGFATDEFIFEPARVLIGLAGLLFSPARGLLFFFPLCVLAPPGLAGISADFQKIKLVIAWLIPAALLLYASWNMWYAGHSWGPRFLAPVLPYLAILSVSGLQKLQQKFGTLSGWLFAGLLLISWMAALHGMLFRTMQDINAATMFDLLKEGSIFSGWERLALIQSYDIFWVQKLIAGNNLAVIFPLLLLPLLAVCILYWRALFQGAPIMIHPIADSEQLSSH